MAQHPPSATLTPCHIVQGCMKLKEYFAAVARVIHEHRTDGEIFDAVTEGQNGDGAKGTVLKEFDRAIAEVRGALLNNKKLLGLFDDDAENPEPKEKKLEREIEEKAMRRHLLKVRRDLSKFAPKASDDSEKIDKITKFEWIVTRIVTDICKELGKFPELGGIFSKTEAMVYRREFEKTEPKPEPKASPAPRPIVASYPKRQVPSSTAVKPSAASIPADLSAPTAPPDSASSPPAKPSATLEELTQRAIAARTKSYQEQKAAIDALNDELRKQGKIL